MLKRGIKRAVGDNREDIKKTKEQESDHIRSYACLNIYKVITKIILSL